MNLELPFAIGDEVKVESVEELKGKVLYVVGYKIEIGTHLANDEVQCVLAYKDFLYDIPSFLVSKYEAM